MTKEELVKKAEDYQIEQMINLEDFDDYEKSYARFENGVFNAHIAGAKAMQEENEQLRNELLQQQQLVRDLKCCGNCDRHDSREYCLYSEECYTYIYIHQYLRPFFCAPVNLKDIEDYEDFWKPISCTYHIRGEKNDSKRP